MTLKPFILWRHTDSNRGPSACKADALNQLSYASLFAFPERDCKDRQLFYFTKCLRQIFFL